MILSLFVGLFEAAYISVSIVRAAKLAQQEKRMEKYLKKHEYNFQRNGKFPDVDASYRCKVANLSREVQRLLRFSSVHDRELLDARVRYRIYSSSELLLVDLSDICKILGTAWISYF
ncbi:hypothetical protein GQ600_23147 [Phytophthora cactorum]|nr:hypothetical protein GQ600_23147 [Phytophthora cactorum]